MKKREYDKVCYWTEQREEKMPLRNIKTDLVGYSFGCTQEGATVQVRLESGELDSWVKEDCVEISGTVQ